jgi:hypothetical protein
MVEDRTFRIVVVDGGHGVAEAISAKADAQIEYDGKEARLECADVTLHGCIV